jgi:hypothetical protein
MTEPNGPQKRETTRLSGRSERLARENIRKRYQHVGRTWNGCFRGIVYIPEEAARHIDASSRNDADAFQAELERLSLLQVPWACAILGYKALLLKSDGGRDVEQALSLCAGPAQAGDAYAQYILSWALTLKGELTTAAAAMRKSAKQLFPPAVLDSANFFWRGSASDLDVEITRFLDLSDRVGHAGTSSRRYAFYRSGRFGVVNLVLGYVLVPFAIVKYFFAARMSPYSARVFAFTRESDARLWQFSQRKR